MLTSKFLQNFYKRVKKTKLHFYQYCFYVAWSDFPELLVLHTVPSQSRVQTVLFTQCVWSWSQESQTTFTIVKLMLLYILPLLFMSVAYWRIVRVLWKSNIPGHNLSTRISHSTEMPLSGGGNPEGQLRSRRKAAKMLVAVVVTFAICFFPVHLLSILRCTMDLPADQWTIAVSLIAHWLCYFNSAVNPLIYNFMSGKFRQEFRRNFRECSSPNRRMIALPTVHRHLRLPIGSGESTKECRINLRNQPF
ncbi:orexin receptor type 2-like isoform X2 [Pseudomyrmex gracilis]|uniref:orexin receptor type 2-like isoform X2 n=1 Tax=Pseudomyrmex gracilis TaxID=219809 RepID=UPI00099566CD|nr:orexin receptor type 2-like isoform X2 [Pseudomyrmex gracilis]